MIRIKMEKRSKRERAENWTEEERNLLRNLVTDRFDIIENKNTDTATNMQKLEAWKEIWERFILLNQRPRTVQKLREQWKRMKLLSKAVKKNGILVKDDGMESQVMDHVNPGIDTYSTPIENGTTTIPQSEYKNARDSIMNPRTRNVTSRLYHSKSGIEYKRSMLELNKLVKEQITNCAMEEHQLKMEQLREEHTFKMERSREMHALQCENERLKNELMKIDIEIKKKQLNSYVI